jgi:hypothetical protein
MRAEAALDWQPGHDSMSVNERSLGTRGVD